MRSFANANYFRADPATPLWRVRILHIVARALGILVHVNGMPVGSCRMSKRFPREFDGSI